MSLLLYTPVPLEAQKDAGSGITQASVKGHLEFLAGDALNGRGSGTRDEWIAASYIASQLRRWGLDPLGDDGGFVQQVDIERLEAAAPPVLSYGSARLTHGKEMVVIARRRPGVRSAAEVPAGRRDPPGSVLLLPDPRPQALGQAAAGAALMLVAETPQTRALFDAARLPSTAAQLKGVAAPGARRRRMLSSKAAHEALSALAEGTPITLATELKPAQVSHTWNAIGSWRAGTSADPRR